MSQGMRRTSGRGSRPRTAARRPRELPPRREGRGRDDDVAQPLDELLRRRKAVLVLPDRFDLDVPAGSIDRLVVRRRRPRPPRSHREAGWRAVPSPPRRADRARRPSGVDHDLRRRDRTFADRASQDVQSLAASRFCGTPSFDPGPSSSAVTGVARASRSAVAPIANTTGRRMIVPASLAQKLRS